MLHDMESFFYSNGHHDMEKRMKLLLLADDMTLIADDALDLQQLLNTLSLYCQENKFTVNTQKTKIMIFQKAGRRAKIRPFKYRDESLEIVKRFVYLGVPFTSSGLFNEAEEHFSEKARNAMGAVWSILAVSKLNDWAKRMELFNSLVSSTLLYCSGIWGLNHTGELDKTQRKFIKIVLSIPQCTPGYMIRSETGTFPLEIRVLKRALKYLVKLEYMAEDRLPRKCLNQLKNLHSSSPKLNKRNWYSRVVECLKETNHEHVLDLDPPLLEEHIDLILGARKLLWYTRDMEGIQSSSYSTRYASIASNNYLQRENYLNLKVPMEVTRVLAQLRLMGEERICFRVKGYFYSFSTNEICQLCNLNQKETLEHIFTICPAYDSVRNELDFHLNLSQMAVDVDKNLAFGVYKYVKKCLRHRCCCLGHD